jgi:hypothetical protein
MTDPEPSYEFDVALSLASEDRDYVTEVNDALKAVGVKTFLDADYLAETWGEDLVEFFDGVYRKRSQFAILFISRHYAEKAWPRLERRSALARALEERGAYVLPVRLDDTEVDGLRPTVGYLDTRKTGIDGLVRALLAKLAGRSGWPDGWPGDRAPRTSRETDEIRSERPRGWEYLYFAGVLTVAKDALEGAYLDHEMGYADPSGVHVADDDAGPFLQAKLAEVRALIGTLSRVMAPEVQERAIGAPGEPGDPDRIKRLAERWTSIYGGLLTWAARLRGTARGEEFDVAFELVARMAEGPIVEYRRFVDDYVAFADGIPAALASGTPHILTRTLMLEIPDGLTGELSAEIDRLKAAGY